jgi:hypothetical protein
VLPVDNERRAVDKPWRYVEHVARLAQVIRIKDRMIGRVAADPQDQPAVARDV